MNIVFIKIIPGLIILCFFVFVLFEPARSAEPPINILFSFTAVKIFSEDFLVARGSRFLKIFFSFL